MIPTGWLRHRARTHAETIAVRDRAGASLTFAELYHVAARAAPAAAALRPSLAIEREPGIGHAIAMNAAMLAGVPFVTLRPGLPPPERRRLLDAVPSTRVLEAGDPPAGDPAWDGPDPAPGETLCHVLTSGTSGARRPVALTYENHFCSAGASALTLGVRSDDVWLCCLPVDHVGGLNVLIRSLIYGTTAVVHSEFDTDAVASELEGGATLVSLVPTQLARLLEAGARIDLPRLILLGGADAPRALIESAEAAGARIAQTYGSTEACSQIATLGLADRGRKRGSVGRPLPGTLVEFADGELVVSGPTISPGAAGPDGRLRTGDRGRIDSEGFLWVEGRIDDVIVSGGENVAPQEVEAALAAHDAVADVAVFGRPDPEWGEAVCAAVVLAAGVEAPAASELEAHCRDRLAAHMVPKAIEVVEELPRTATGKLRRRALR